MRSLERVGTLFGSGKAGLQLLNLGEQRWVLLDALCLEGLVSLNLLSCASSFGADLKEMSRDALRTK